MITPDLAGSNLCDLETTGRIMHRAHRVEMWFAADPERDRIYMLSGGRVRASRPP